MKHKIRILQLGVDNWSSYLMHDDNEVSWTFINVDLVQEEKYYKEFLQSYKLKKFNAVLVTDKYSYDVINKLEAIIDPYSLIIDSQFSTMTSPELMTRKQPLFMDMIDKLQIVNILKLYFFSGQMGAKLHTNSITVSPYFKGNTQMYGQYHLRLNGKYSKEEEILTWQYNIPLGKQNKKIWLEFSNDENIEITLVIRKIALGSSEVVETLECCQNQLKESIEIEHITSDNREIGYLSISLKAQGVGKINIGPLHYRNTRGIYGEYVIGGEQLYDSKTNEEIYVYFHPGDLTPPLNIYFSGYRQAEGFEGFSMMKRLGAPFILVTDPRLEGGAFYIGSDELEKKIKGFIEEKLNLLKFTNNQLILSGLSMGTFGALYYGSKLNPSNIIIGKPLVNIGDIAKNEKIVRPGGFPTSLDILLGNTNELNTESVQFLNDYFWKNFNTSSFENVKFIVAFMKEDDYDHKAYRDLINALSDKKSTLISKGISGRHNDNSQAINEWFIQQYKKVLSENFGRKLNE